MKKRNFLFLKEVCAKMRIFSSDMHKKFIEPATAVAFLTPSLSSSRLQSSLIISFLLSSFVSEEQKGGHESKKRSEEDCLKKGGKSQQKKVEN